MKLLVAILTTGFCAIAPCGFAADRSSSFEGTVSITETRGDAATQFLFTRKGDQLRIENRDKSKPEPSNIVDLAAQKLTIVYPHNSTFVVVDLAKVAAQSGASNLPPGFPTSQNTNSVGEAADASPARTFPGTTASSPTVQKISPPPGFPSPPPMPSMPQMPNPAAAGPMMPPMPPMGSFDGMPELKKTDKKKKIQGFDCTLYTISDRMETFEIWATNDSALFPFRLLERSYNRRHFGPVMIEEQWIDLLQKKSLFPLEATLHRDLHLRPENLARTSPAANAGDVPDPGQERLSFKVEKIEEKKIDNEKLFQPPEGYFEIQSPII